MSKVNVIRVLMLYFISIFPIGLFCFILLIFPMIQETPDFSSPGAGMIVIVYGLVSCLIGLAGAIPFALFIEYLFAERSKKHIRNIRQTTYIF